MSKKLGLKTLVVLGAAIGLGSGGCATTSPTTRSMARAENNVSAFSPPETSNHVEITHYKKVEELLELARRECQKNAKFYEAYGTVNDITLPTCIAFNRLAIQEAIRLTNASAEDWDAEVEGVEDLSVDKLVSR